MLELLVLACQHLPSSPSQTHTHKTHTYTNTQAAQNNNDNNNNDNNNNNKPEFWSLQSKFLLQTTGKSTDK